MTRTLREVSGTRVIRAELLAMATAVARSPGRTETLKLINPTISEKRLEEEWGAAAEALRPDILARLSLEVVLPSSRILVFGRNVGVHALEDVPQRASKKGVLRIAQRDLSFAVEKLLVWAWLTARGPITRKWLERTAGCSYPTVAAVLKRLGSTVRRHPDRRIELAHLPREEWARLFAVSGAARCVLRFADTSDQPATAAALLRRLRQIAPSGVAVGGVVAALHYHSDLDLVGLPRLDLAVHAPERDIDISFVRQLDPALKQVVDNADPALLVLHFVRHKESLFEQGSRGLPWADPVECVLDLHEAGLETQALALIETLGASVSGHA